jgi:hypothetical protein
LAEEIERLSGEIVLQRILISSLVERRLRAEMTKIGALKAERKAEERIEAEKQAKKEAEEQARRKSEEQARRTEAEEQTRRTEAEEQARKEAEEQARKEAEEQARIELLVRCLAFVPVIRCFSLTFVCVAIAWALAPFIYYGVDAFPPRVCSRCMYVQTIVGSLTQEPYLKFHEIVGSLIPRTYGERPPVASKTTMMQDRWSCQQARCRALNRKQSATAIRALHSNSIAAVPQ